MSIRMCVFFFRNACLVSFLYGFLNVFMFVFWCVLLGDNMVIMRDNLLEYLTYGVCSCQRRRTCVFFR